MQTRDFVRYFLVSTLIALAGDLACSSEEQPQQQADGPYANPTTTCAQNADCGGDTPICDPLRGCVACQFDTECADQQRCVNRACEPLLRCSTHVDCAETETPACDGETGICEQCLLDEHCGGGKRCLDNRCQLATECLNSRDCGDDRVCDRASGWCVECAGDADCDEDATCVENACVSRCSSDKDCAAQDLLCSPEGGFCVECVANVDCPESYHCVSGSCEIDVCQPGDGRCEATENAALNCNDSGSDFVPVLCPSRTTCVEEDGSAACAPWVCVPGTPSCSDDGSTVRVCAVDGMGFTDSMNCGDQGGTCEGGTCVDVVCDADESLCSDGSIYRCNTTGTALTLTAACAVTSHCDEETVTCEPDVCIQGTPTCNGSVATTCNADGSGFDSGGTDCSDTGETCFQGQCLPELCDSGVRHCYGGSVYFCLDAGTRRTLYDTCKSSEYCDDSGASAVCRARQCTPNRDYCSGEVAGTCNAQGSGPVDGSTTDCSTLDGKACYLGKCLDEVCPGNYGCNNGNPYTCTANGTGFGSQRDTCLSSEHCAENVSWCRIDVCTQGTPACDGNTATTCKADGSGYDPGGTDCGDEQRCVNGTCLPIICTANTYYCDGGNVFRCGSDGTTTTLNDTCTAAEYCLEGWSTCRVDVCEAGQPYCNGALVSTCKADGSGPEDGGTSCPTGKICEDGACADIVCTPDDYFCLENNGERCNSLGTGWTRYRTCSDAYFCDDSGETAICVADICEAGQAACDGEALATCDTYGGGYASSTTDCSATNQVCNLSACVNEDVVSVGSGGTGTSQTTSYTYFNVYQATSSRSLKKIEQMFSVSGTSQFTWYVYESSTATGSYTKVFESLNTSSGVSAYHSSGAIDVSLVAGNYYLIGVRVVGSHSYFSASTTSPEWLSLGAWRNSRSTTAVPGASFNVSRSNVSTAYTQRLTTAAP